MHVLHVLESGSSRLKSSQNPSASVEDLKQRILEHLDVVIHHRFLLLEIRFFRNSAERQESSHNSAIIIQAQCRKRLTH